MTETEVSDAVVYPDVTPAVVRMLYGSAYRCARPKCSKPLYVTDNETGKRTRNSVVAHIHAKRSGNPRFLLMDPEENRAFENLLLLCSGDHELVDTYPDRFTADTLRQWKTDQIDECEKLGYQPYASMSDEEVEDIRRESIKSDQVRSDALLRLVRCIEELRQISSSVRSKPAGVVAAWKSATERIRRSSLVYDDQGERLYAELPWADSDHYRSLLVSALKDAANTVTAGAVLARTELAAVRVSYGVLSEYCDWVADAIDALEAASRAWPEPPPYNDGEQFGESLTRLQDAFDALIKATSGEMTAVPPRVPKPEEAEGKNHPDWVAEHCALLDRARPFSRVSHRAFDSDLRREVADSTAFAASLPELPQTITYGLGTTSGLAVAVAGNASTEELLGLISDDQLRKPLCAAVSLLRETYREFKETENSEVAVRAGAAIVDMLQDRDWSKADAWYGNELHGDLIFGTLSALTSDNAVRVLLTSAMERDPEIMATIVLSCATWYEEREHRPPYPLRAAYRTYRTLPSWFPAQKVLSLAGSHTEKLGVANAKQGEVGPLLEQIANIWARSGSS